ncbi:hypothetical protein GGH95_006839, partial [Coemansia sp. RSA 1836]
MGRGASMSFDEPRTPAPLSPLPAARATKRHSLDTHKQRRCLDDTCRSPSSSSSSSFLRSPKFFAKVTWVDTLSQLATMVPLSQISIPAPVSEHNAKVDAGARAGGGGEGALLAPPPLNALNESLAFGVPLAALMRRGNHVVLPRPVRECIAFLRRHGAATEGVFRRSPPSTALRAAKAAYNGGQAVDLSLGGGVHVAAVLLKLFFRELPAPVFGNDGDYAVVRALP